MPNSFVDSLPEIDASSLFHANIYVAVNGASYQMPWKEFAGITPKDLSTTLATSGTQTTNAGTSTWTTIPFDVVSVDARGWFDSNSKGLVQVDYNGAMRVYLSLHVNSDGMDGINIRMLKNSNTFFGGLHYGNKLRYGQADIIDASHVFTVTSGDFLEMQISALNTPEIISSVDGNGISHITFQPVSFWS